MRARGLVGAILVLSVGAGSGCSAPAGGIRPAGADPRIGLFSFVEEGNLVLLVASTRAARYRSDRPYFPVEIVVANKGLASLTLTPESFALVDPGGKEYAPVGRDELARSYGGTDVDRRFGELEAVLGAKLAEYTRVPCNLTPDFDDPIARDRLFLPRFGYIRDFLYFPRPEGGVAHRALELTLRAPELPEPVFVRFVVLPREG